MQPSNISPYFSFIRNIILAFMSFAVWVKYPIEPVVTIKWKNNLILFIMSFAIFVSGYTFEFPALFANNTENHRFINEKIQSTELSKYVKTSIDSTYLIFCFSYTCPHCLNSIENLREYQKSNAVDSVIVFAVGNMQDKLIFKKNFQPDFFVNDLSVNDMDKLTNAYPTAFYIEQDTVKVIIQSVLPSPFVFKKTYNLPDSY